MSSRLGRPALRPVAIALCLMLGCVATAVVWAATAQAAEYKMVACASTSGAPPYTTQTNTISAAHPNGIFDFGNYCGGAGGDPPGEAAFMRIAEHEASGNAGEGAYGRIVFETPSYVHFRSGGGYTREPNAFNEGWRARFWGLDFSNNGNVFLNQGAGLSNSGTNWITTSSFGSHLWPFGAYLDFHHFYFELLCVRPAGCDRTNYNATDANGFVFILSDDSPAQVSLATPTSPLLSGEWVHGTQGVSWVSSDAGSGLRLERLRVDGAERDLIDYQAIGQCNVTSSQTNGEFARAYAPCPTGFAGRSYALDTASLADGSHSLSVCTQDYAQYRGLNGTGSESCVARTIRVDNTAPGAPAGLHVLSANPARYLDHFGAQFSLPPDPGSPIAKVHYEVVNAAGEAVTPEGVLAGTNPTELGDIHGPAKAGDYQLKVWLEDSVGLSGPATTAPIPHDTTPPAAPQGLQVTSPETPRSAEGFDLRWSDIADTGSPIDAAHYQVLDGAGKVAVATQTVKGEGVAAIEDLEAPSQPGPYTLRLWLQDEEGNVGAPATAPLSYQCVRSDAGGATSLSAGVGTEQSGEAIVSQGEGSVLTGRLAEHGDGVAGAPVCVFARVTTEDRREFLGIAISRPQGGYSFAIPAGPSREVSALYRSGHRELGAKALLQTVVHPAFDVRRKVVRNEGTARFTGYIPGPDNDNVVVVLQVKRGKGWLAFRRYRTRAGGKVTVDYRFTRTENPTRYVMRAQVRSQAGYPYLQGNSDELALIVRPGEPTTTAAGRR
jgi:hypothetical protein